MANRFWVGGTGTWDAADTTHWSATTGGAGGASVPGTGDAAVFDASSGGGTVTVNATITIQSITMGAFTGTLDFSANNNNVTLSTATGLSVTGTGARTLNMGNGTWTFTIGSTATCINFTTVTNLTFNANSSTIVLNGTATGQRTFETGGRTFNVVTYSDATGGAGGVGGLLVSGGGTFATFNVSSPARIGLASGSILNITNAFTWTGTSFASAILLENATGTAATISTATGTATIAYGAIRGITFSGGATFTASNSFNLGGTSGITITGPSGGGQRVYGG